MADSIIQNNGEIQKYSSKTVQKGIDATEVLLTQGEGLLKQIMQDFTPNNQGKVTGPTIITVAKTLGFVFSHPVATFNLFRFVKSSKASEKNTLETFLKNDIIWNFIKSNADYLPAVGKMIAGTTAMPEFTDGGILDTGSLEIIKECFKKDKNLKTIQNSLIELTETNPDYNKITAGALHLLSDKNMGQYFESKGAVIRDYIKSKKNSPNFGNLIRVYNVDNELFEITPKLFTKIPEIRGIFAKLNEEGLIPAVFDALHMINKDPELSSFFQKNPQIISKIAKSVIEETLMIKEVAKEYKFNSKLLDIADILLTKPELSKDLVLLFHKKDWVKLITTIIKNLEDPVLSQFIKDNQLNIISLVEGLGEKVPIMKSYIPPQVKLNELIEIALKNPESLNQILGGLESGGIKSVFTSLKNIVQIFGLKAATQVTKDYFAAKNPQEQVLINNLLSDIAATHSLKFVEHAKDLLKNTSNISINSLFDYANITPTNALKIENQEIKDISFVKSKLSNISFNNTKFTNVSFEGASLSNVSFHGAILDKNTLASLQESLKNKTISLKGAKIIGDLANLDLAGISFDECDLSKVTSLKNVNFKGTDLNKALLPDSELFAGSYNFDLSIFLDNFDKHNITIRNNNQIVGKALDNVVSFYEKEGKEIVKTNKAIIKHTLRELINSNTVLSNYVKISLEQNPKKNLPIKDARNLHNIADYSGTPEIFTAIYESLNNPDNLKIKLTASLLASEVNKELFPIGTNEGQDAYFVKKRLEETIIKFKDQNPDFKIETLPNNEKFKDMVRQILDELRPDVKVTAMVSDGNQSLLSSNLSYIINNNLSKYKLTQAEEQKARDIAAGVGRNLFGDGVNKDRKDDVNLIEKTIKNSLLNMKIRNKHEGDHMSAKLANNIKGIIGSKDSSATLAALYYNNSNYTSAGLLTGGIYLNKAKFGNEFNNKLENNLQRVLYAQQKGAISKPKSIGSPNGRSL